MPARLVKSAQPPKVVTRFNSFSLRVATFHLNDINSTPLACGFHKAGRHCAPALGNLQMCKTANTLGIQITNLSTTASIPTKCGKILNGPECKTRGMKKNDCLKSFDARITGQINGWIFAKITVSSGGHQDNVFEEAHIMGEWFVKYGNPDELHR